MTTNDTSGRLDEALERLHTNGPERGRPSHHAPMVVASPAARGQAGAVHRRLDLYRPRPEEFPDPVEPVTDADRRAARGDIRRAADWIAYFTRALTERPWREVLALSGTGPLPGRLTAWSADTYAGAVR
ncbi:hypothetical protein ACFWM5_40150 [Streptomyces bobili]|uniref:hypothetical protein n=1 Tax=Streptomyces bobili TaxID=67280 RepID=UPI00365AD7B4